MYHSPKARKTYLRGKTADDKLPADVCPFCDPHQHTTVVAENKHSFVIANRTPYSQWELQQVVDHLMIIPRRHVLSLSELNRDESTEITHLLGKYEQQGYDIFARSPRSVKRSVPHQHTHLIKTDGRLVRGLFFWERPYIMKLFR